MRDQQPQLPLRFERDSPVPNFSGASYVAHLDFVRLDTQLARIVRYMTDPPGVYRTVGEIARAMRALYPDAGWPENSIQAQLRNAIKKPLRYRKARRRRGKPDGGLFEFALWPPDEHELEGDE